MSSWRSATSVVAAMVLLGACSSDRKNEQLMEPNADLMPATATAMIGGTEYTYGCPDWPCPVLPIVAEQIALGNYIWLAPGTFTKPAIYLTVLKVPVLLRLERGHIIEPTPLDPSLTGPEEMEGTYSPSTGQLVCANVGLELIAPDHGPWDFVSGSVVVTGIPGHFGAFGVGQPTTMSLSDVDFQELLAGTYDVYSPWGNTSAYEATFTATLRRVNSNGTYMKTVEHTMVCGDSDYFDDEEDDEEEEPPPAPYLRAPDRVRGRIGPDLGLVCENFDIALVSPDGGPWAYVDGEVMLEYLRWGPDLQKWISTGVEVERYFTTASWDDMLHGISVVYPDDPEVQAYKVHINGVVMRDGVEHDWTYPVGDSFLCLPPDFFDTKVEQVIKR